MRYLLGRSNDKVLGGEDKKLESFCFLYDPLRRGSHTNEVQELTGLTPPPSRLDTVLPLSDISGVD